MHARIAQIRVVVGSDIRPLLVKHTSALLIAWSALALRPEEPVQCVRHNARRDSAKKNYANTVDHCLKEKKDRGVSIDREMELCQKKSPQLTGFRGVYWSLTRR